MTFCMWAPHHKQQVPFHIYFTSGSENSWVRQCIAGLTFIGSLICSLHLTNPLLRSGGHFHQYIWSTWLDTNLAIVYTVISVPWKLCYLQECAIVVLLEASIWSACHTTSHFRILALFTVVCMLVLNYIFLIVTVSNRWGWWVRLGPVQVKPVKCWADWLDL